jgi:hypothetical protein
MLLRLAAYCLLLLNVATCCCMLGVVSACCYVLLHIAVCWLLLLHVGCCCCILLRVATRICWYCPRTCYVLCPFDGCLFSLGIFSSRLLRHWLRTPRSPLTLCLPPRVKRIQFHIHIRPCKHVDLRYDCEWWRIL